MPAGGVVGYARVSTGEQEEHGISLPAQASKIRTYCQLHDLQLVDLLEETASAKSLERPKLQQALSMLRSGKADAILVVKLDRLTRSLRDLLLLIEEWFQGHDLLSVTEHVDTRTSAGRLLLNILAVVAQWEREAIGERTSFAMEHLAELGYWIGTRPPFGWEPSEPDASGRRRLVPHGGEQRIIEEAILLRGNGLALRAISGELWKRGYRPRFGAAWSPELVLRMTKPGRQAG